MCVCLFWLLLLQLENVVVLIGSGEQCPREWGEGRGSEKTTGPWLLHPQVRKAVAGGPRSWPRSLGVLPAGGPGWWAAAPPGLLMVVPARAVGETGGILPSPRVTLNRHWWKRTGQRVTPTTQYFLLLLQQITTNLAV